MSIALEPLRSASMLRRMLRLLSLCALVQLSSVVGSSSAKAADISEYEVKAAFVLNFTKFVQLPLGAAEPAGLVLCVAGDESDLQPFQRLTGKLVGTRAMSVHVIEEESEANQCQVLFIARSSLVSPVRLLEAIKGKSVLTVGEEDDFLRVGGVIRFFSEAGRIRFAIRRSRAEAAGISVSSKLLALAVVED